MSDDMVNPTRMLLSVQQLKRLYEELLADVRKEYGITPVETDILAFLANNPSYDTATDIVDMRMIAKSYVSTSVENLVQKGLLTRIPDAHDRRIIHLKLTDLTPPIIADIRTRQEEFAQILFTGLTAEEVDAFKDLHSRIFDNANQASVGTGH